MIDNRLDKSTSSGHRATTSNMYPVPVQQHTFPKMNVLKCQVPLCVGRSEIFFENYHSALLCRWYIKKLPHLF